MRPTIRMLEKSIREICRRASPLEWNEDHISYSLMTRLREIFGRRRIRFTGWSKIVEWQSFKNRGTQETKYGDIALIVTIQFSSGEMLRGVACLEAKRDFQSGNFESIDLSQLTRIRGNVPHAQLLLYNGKVQTWPLKFPNGESWSSHMWVSPLNTVIAKLPQLDPNVNKRLMRIMFCFSNFLMARVFWGHDLDYRQEVIDDIVRGMGRYFQPAYLGVVNVFYDNQQAIGISVGEQWEPI